MLKKAFYLFTPIVFGSGVGFLIKNHIDYNMLVKPPLSPPSIIFPIMWSGIYILLGISYYLYKKNSTSDKKLDTIYYAGLTINFLWSIIFFIFKLRLISSLWIVLLDIFVILLIIEYLKKNKLSAYLNIPYILWTSFATYLTIGIYLLN